MRVDLHYGEGFLSADLQARDVQLLLPSRSEVSLSISSEVIRSLEAVREKSSLSKQMSRANSISMAIDLQQGYGLTEMLVSEVLSYFQSLSNLDLVTLISPSEPVFLASGSDAFGFEVSQQKPEEKNLQFVGETPSHSTPVFADRGFIEADLRVSLGTVRLDAAYGATGGPISALRATCGEKTLLRNQKLAATRRLVPFGLNSVAVADARETAALLGIDSFLNTVTDFEGTLCQMASGDMAVQWSPAVSSLQGLAGIPLQQRADIVVVTPGGFPHDATLMSSVQALMAGYLSSEHGGVILLVAECRDGAGPRGFVDGVSEFGSEEELSAAAESSYRSGMEYAGLVHRVLSSRSVVLCSRLRRSLVEERLRCHSVRDPEEGLEQACQMISSLPRVSMITHGSDSLPLPP
jgi:nickel-dependent lactate racemase